MGQIFNSRPKRNLELEKLPASFPNKKKFCNKGSTEVIVLHGS